MCLLDFVSTIKSIRYLIFLKYIEKKVYFLNVVFVLPSTVMIVLAVLRFLLSMFCPKFKKVKKALKFAKRYPLLSTKITM